jgi:hypothetical protein
MTLGDKHTTKNVYVPFLKDVQNCAKLRLRLRKRVCANWTPIECLRVP